ncbi:hypothetical protein DFQ29_010061 [Apophysomyces sp. BC1021]|nr:hypothetical protein DFQ29_010061 [Apophysomyces sp. BC1021]
MSSDNKLTPVKSSDSIASSDVMENSNLDENRPVYRLYAMRFYGLTLIVFLNIVSSMNWLSVATVPDYAATFFGNVSLTAINWFSNVFMLIYIVAGPLSGYVFDRFSIKTGIVVGAALQTSGAWLRFFSSFIHEDNYAGRYALAMFGQFLVIACATSAFAIPTLFIPREPKTPPSYSASTHIERRQAFHVYIIQLLKNYNFILVVVAFSVLCGLVSTISSLLAQIVGPYGVSVDDAGYLGVAFIVAGVVGAVCTGIFIDKTKKHKLVLRTFVPITGFMFLALVFVVKRDNYVPIAVICALLGFFVFSLLPVALELSVECSYPVSESVSSSMLWMCSQVFALVFLVSMDALREDHGDPPGSMRRALIMGAGLSLPMTILAFAYNSPNKRLESEQMNITTSRVLQLDTGRLNP